VQTDRHIFAVNFHSVAIEQLNCYVISWYTETGNCFRCCLCCRCFIHNIHSIHLICKWQNKTIIQLPYSRSTSADRTLTMKRRTIDWHAKYTLHTQWNLKYVTKEVIRLLLIATVCCQACHNATIVSDLKKINNETENIIVLTVCLCIICVSLKHT